MKNSKTMPKKLLTLLVLFLYFTTISSTIAAPKINFVMPANENDKAACEESDGKWEMMKNGCGDSCFSHEKAKIMCTMALKASCNCGPGRCFDTEEKTCRDIKNIVYEENH